MNLHSVRRVRRLACLSPLVRPERLLWPHVRKKDAGVEIVRRRGCVSAITRNVGRWVHGTIAPTLLPAPVAVVDSGGRAGRSADLHTVTEHRLRMNFRIEHPVHPAPRKKRRIRPQPVRRGMDRRVQMEVGALQDQMALGEVPIQQDRMEVLHRVGGVLVYPAGEIVLGGVRHPGDQMEAMVQRDRLAAPTQGVQQGRMDQAGQTVPGDQMEVMVLVGAMHPSVQMEAMVLRETDRMAVRPVLRHRRAPASVVLVSSVAGR